MNPNVKMPVRVSHVSNSYYLKSVLNDWIEKRYIPAYFLTVRLPEHWETANYFNAKSHLRMMMKVFERSLFGKRWNKHHLAFIAFAEHGAGLGWHYHILLEESNFSERELQRAINQTNRTLRLPAYCLFLEPIINQVDIVKFYSKKEIKVNLNGHFDSDRFIFLHDLFHLK